MYLSVVRPVEMRFYEHLHKHDADLPLRLKDLMTFVFVAHGRRLKDDNITTAFASLLSKAGLAMGFRQYRHVAIALGRQLQVCVCCCF